MTTASFRSRRRSVPGAVGQFHHRQVIPAGRQPARVAPASLVPGRRWPRRPVPGQVVNLGMDVQTRLARNEKGAGASPLRIFGRAAMPGGAAVIHDGEDLGDDLFATRSRSLTHGEEVTRPAVTTTSRYRTSRPRRGSRQPPRVSVTVRTVWLVRGSPSRVQGAVGQDHGRHLRAPPGRQGGVDVRTTSPASLNTCTETVEGTSPPPPEARWTVLEPWLATLTAAMKRCRCVSRCPVWWSAPGPGVPVGVES